MLEEQRIRNHALHEESKSKMLQTDVKLKRAEEMNQNLAIELDELKAKFESLEPGSPVKKRRQTMDLLNDLDRMFDDDKTFVGGGGNNLNMTAFGNDLFGSEADPVQEYEFKVKVMEHDLQSMQNENNALVQTVLKLRQEFRERKSMHDEVAVKIINQEISEFKREILSSDEKFVRLNEEVNDLKYKLEKMTSSSQRTIPIENLENLKNTVDQLEQSNKVAIIELCDLKDKNRKNQQLVDIERNKRANDKAASIEQMEKESLVVGELRNKILVLNNSIKELEAKKSKDEMDQSMSIKHNGNKYTKEHLKNLRQTNERLMSEILRLNGIIKEQKAAGLSRMQQSLSMSAIQFNEQSFDQSFISKFK
jgi:hypothetical protein